MSKYGQFGTLGGGISFAMGKVLADRRAIESDAIATAFATAGTVSSIEMGGGRANATES